MRDRFDQRQQRNLEAQLTGDDVVVRPPLTIVTGQGLRREWPADEKTRIIVESLTPGANVSEVARRNGLSPQHLAGGARRASCSPTIVAKRVQRPRLAMGRCL